MDLIVQFFSCFEEEKGEKSRASFTAECIEGLICRSHRGISTCPRLQGVPKIVHLHHKVWKLFQCSKFSPANKSVWNARSSVNYHLLHNLGYADSKDFALTGIPALFPEWGLCSLALTFVALPSSFRFISSCSHPFILLHLLCWYLLQGFKCPLPFSHCNRSWHSPILLPSCLFYCIPELFR